MSREARWRTNPLEYFTEVQGQMAVSALRVYQGSTGIYFDKIAYLSRQKPYEYTWSDIASVNGLSVNMEAPTAWNIVHHDGALATRVNELLRELSPDLTLAEATQTDLEPAYGLWRLLQSERGLGGGGVVLSKLLAAKRPKLIPIRDNYVLDALFESTRRNSKGESTFDMTLDDWEPWRQYMSSDYGARVTQAAEEALRLAAYPIPISVLRTIDIVVWMRHKGWQGSSGNIRKGLPPEFSFRPTFVGEFVF